MKNPFSEQKTAQVIQLNIPEALRNAVYHSMYFLLSFMLSRTVILDDLSPFSIALCAAAPPKYSISAFAGAFIGCFFKSPVAYPYRYIGAIVAAAVIGTLMHFFCTKQKNAVLLSCTNAFACCLVTGIALTITSAFSFDDVLRYTGESILCGGSAYFFAKSKEILNGGLHLPALTASKLSTLAVCIGIPFIAITSVNINDFAPGRVLAVFAILVACRYTGVTGGTIVGVILGLAGGLGGNMLFLAGVYSIAALASGIFSTYGQFGSAVAFVLSSCGAIVLSNQPSVALPLMIEVAIASVLFVMLPQKWSNQIDNYINAKIDILPVNSLRNSLVVKLRFASGALNGLSQSVESATKKFEELSAPNFSSISKNVCTELCASCNLKELCWKKEGAKTINAFNKLYPTSCRDGMLTEENLPKEFTEICVKCDRLMASYNRQFRLFSAEEGYRLQMSRLREIVAEQFYGISDMIMDLSNEFEQAEKYDITMSEQVRRCFASHKIVSNDVCCVIDKYGRLRIEAHCPQPVRTVNDRRFHSELCKICARELDFVNVTFAGHEALVSFCQKANYTLTCGTAQHARGNNNLCGDSIEIINDGKGREIVIISDGMGSGARAAIDGAMASSLLSRLIKAGFGFDCSLRVVNSALQIKSTEESFATLDIVCFDLFTGKTDFYKAGASSSFVKKGEKTIKVELPSLPAGILKDVEFAKTSTFLEAGDKIVLFSDGIADSDTAWLRERLENDKALDSQALAQSILQQALSMRRGAQEDDMTVVVAQIS